MNEDEQADHDDELAYQRWLEQNDRDPHRLQPRDERNWTEVTYYVRWHKARIRTIDQILAELAPVRPPLLLAQRAHHDGMRAQFRAILPAKQPKRAKPLKTAPPTDADRAAETVRYARLHGITVRQAAEILTRQGATR